MINTTSMPLQDMRKAERDGATCGECGGRMFVAWIDGEFVLRCQDLNHTTITYRDKQREQKIMEVRMDSTALTTMTEMQMIERVNLARFPKELTQVDKQILANAAISYGFDPLMGEISVYQGHPFVSIDGRYRKAQETGLLDGVETRPATKQEREDWEIKDGDYFFRSEVYVKGSSRPFVGWGRVRASETIGGKGFTPVETNPQRMAEKRAEAQALRKAFSIPLPSLEDIGSPDVDYPVDASTGEIIDTTAEEVENTSTVVEPTATDTKSSQAQRTKLFAAANEQSIPKEELQKYIQYHYQKNSTKDLTFKEASAIIQAIETGDFKYVEQEKLV